MGRPQVEGLAACCDATSGSGPTGAASKAGGAGKQARVGMARGVPGKADGA